MYLIESNHLISISEAFRPVNVGRGRSAKSVKGQVPSAAGTMAIHLNNPPLCT